MSDPLTDAPDDARRQAQRDAALRELIETVPYIGLLGVRFDRLGDELTGRLPFKPMLIGNPSPAALHGGVTGSFLEITALVQLAWEQVLARMETAPVPPFPAFPKTIDITVDYLRPGQPRDTFARASVQKAGRRVVNLHVQAWQDSRARPIAMLRGNFLMPGEALG